MFQSTKIIELGSCAFRQPKAKSHCRHIHGYRLLSKIWFNCNNLDENNWVVDFGGLKDLKTLLEHTFDHTLVIDETDPQLHLFRQIASVDAAKIVVMTGGVGIEKFAKFVFNVSNEFIKSKTNSRAWVSKVEVWEHEKNSAIYHEALDSQQLQTLETSLQGENISTIGLGSVVPEEIKLELPSQTQPAPTENPYAAKVGNVKSTGWSNPFAGTSWGA
jgi:6-pyruvoyltetrahydropterin/6-carboxytetrahydropterin synthase